MRFLQIASVTAAAGAAIFVFQVKYRAEAVAERAATLQRELDQENEALSLLEAEWSLLIQPARVQQLVERHPEQLKLQPLDPVQITRLESLPMRPTGPAPEDESALSAILDDAQREFPLGSGSALAAPTGVMPHPRAGGPGTGDTVEMGEQR
jgi:hypothetical protein